MLELPHVMVGATIAVLVPDPALAAPLALSSHFLGDLIPHWNPHLGTEMKNSHHLSSRTLLVMAVDSGLALTVGLILAASLSQNSPARLVTILLCSLLAVLPDVLEIPYYLFRKNYKYLKGLRTFQHNHQWNIPFLPGLITQTLVILLCVYALTLSA